ncbi:hypothetical protein [Streptomyces viridochromogenes]|uniref:Integral membrane protein n=1 Tax=Streptomyces viridochromogenes Tue57 TaxID=1160705 RepID=L8P6N1_STRVR|nr:hypothetical protein [Streptomyces viridochromogenes]ELS53231.1 hypothetical protein STVIR_5736 [Streptomyces viridochromogenes Tue57]
MDLLSGSAAAHGAWYYLVLVGALATPLVPNAALVVAGGVLAAQGELLLPLVWAAVFTGGLGGDLLLYAAARRLPLGRRSAAVRSVAARLRRRGLFLLVLRYLPAGRFTGTVGAAMGGMRIGGFICAMVLAEASWTTLYVALGYGGMTALSYGPLPAVAIAVTACVGLGAPLVARLLRRRSVHLCVSDPVQSGDSCPACPGRIQ